jgi:PAS domain S-box-containing protein
LLDWIGRPRAALATYGIATGAVLLATALRAALDLAAPAPDTVPYAFHFLAVLVAAAAGGLGPGLFATLLSALAGWLLFLTRAVSFAGAGLAPTIDLAALQSTRPLIDLAVFVFNGVLISAAAAALRTAITRRRSAEAALRLVASQREEFLRTLDAMLAHVPIGYAFFDREHRYVRLNESVARISGLPVHAYTGRTIREIPLVHPGSVDHILARVFVTAESVGDVEIAGRNAGEPRTWLAGFFPVCNELGDVELVGATMVDISERKRAEHALQESERRFRAVADTMPQLVWSTRPDGAYEYYNQRCLEFAGVPPDNGYGGGWRDLIHPDDRDKTRQAWHSSLETGKPYEIEYRFRDRTGRYHWFLGRAVPIHDDRGRIERWLGTCTDISDIVEAREMLGRARDEQERIVAERTAELGEANARLRAEIEERGRAEEQLRRAHRMEAVGQLTGGLAHDFNNLLTVMIGNVEAIQRRLGNDGDATIRRYAEFAMQGGRRAAALTQRLLAFARGQPLEPTVVDANKLLSTMSELLLRTVGEKVSLKTVFADGLWFAEVDPNQLESALLNLAANARDAMRDGGTLTIETANIELDRKSAAHAAEVPPGQYVMLSVSDTGVGMSEETLGRAFEPFFTTKPTGEGTGLGLSQTYGFVKQSGGYVTLSSELGKGTTVRILLPRLTGARAKTAAEQRPEAPPVQVQETVLVVEDDSDVRRHAVNMLEELGYRTIEAGDGNAALRLLETNPDIRFMFTDIGLPGDYNGRELAEEAMRRRPYLKVLYTTGYAKDMIIRQGKLDPRVVLVPKPFTFEELAAKVKLAFETKQRSILLVEDEVLVAAVAADALRELGYDVIDVTTAESAIEHAKDDIDTFAAAIIDIGLPDGRGDDLAAELRGLRSDLPIIIASGHGESQLSDELNDGRTTVLGKPYDMDGLRAALSKLNV